jgi:hypothetical protein
MSNYLVLQWNKIDLWENVCVRLDFVPGEFIASLLSRVLNISLILFPSNVKRKFTTSSGCSTT